MTKEFTRQNDKKEKSEFCDRYMLPSDTVPVLGDLREVDNMSLRVQKYIIYPPENKIKEGEKFSLNAKSLLTRVSGEQKEIFTLMKESMGFLPLSVVGCLDSRLLLGFGTQSVYETGITMHHTYSIPYIPASSIKGVIRSYVINEFFEGNEKVACKNEDFSCVFGSNASDSEEKSSLSKKTSKRGLLVVFDSYPEKVEKLDVDIMNLHYPSYYTGGGLPTDDQSPIPIVFYAVPQGTKFLFHFSVGNSEKGELSICSKPLSDIIKDALIHFGLGAKTSSGYGRMMIQNESSDNNQKIGVKLEKVLKKEGYAYSIGDQVQLIVDKIEKKYKKIKFTAKEPDGSQKKVEFKDNKEYADISYDSIKNGDLLDMDVWVIGFEDSRTSYKVSRTFTSEK